MIEVQVNHRRFKCETVAYDLKATKNSDFISIEIYPSGDGFMNKLCSVTRLKRMRRGQTVWDEPQFQIPGLNIPMSEWFKYCRASSLAKDIADDMDRWVGWVLHGDEKEGSSNDA